MVVVASHAQCPGCVSCLLGVLSPLLGGIGGQFTECFVLAWMAAKSSFLLALNQSWRLQEQRGTVAFSASMMALLRYLKVFLRIFARSLLTSAWNASTLSGCFLRRSQSGTIFLDVLCFFLHLRLTLRHSLSFIVEWLESTPVLTIFALVTLALTEFDMMKWSIWYRPLMLAKLVQVWYFLWGKLVVDILRLWE
jgi:hypothetical protein